MKTELFAKMLVKANGIDKAIIIAERSKANSRSDMEGQLPKGIVFFPLDKKKSDRLAVAERISNHGFWTHVVGILRKIS